MSFITSNPGQKRVLIYCYERRKSSVPVALVFVVFGNESNQLSQAAILNQQNTNLDVILFRSCASVLVLQCAEGHGVTLTHPHRSSSSPFLHQSTEHEFRRYFVPKLCISSTVRRGSRRYGDPSLPVVEFTLPAPVNRTRIWTLFFVTKCASVLQCAEGHGVTLTHPHWSSSSPIVQQSTGYELATAGSTVGACVSFASYLSINLWSSANAVWNFL